MGGRGSKGSNGSKKSYVRASMPAVTYSQAESLVRDSGWFGKKSRISLVEVLRENTDGTVDLRFTFNTTPAPGSWYSEDKRIVIRKVIANHDR